jgi:hypothetical protein
MDRFATTPAGTATLILACYAVGLILPDLDLMLPFGHRSALTHSALAAGILFLRHARPAAAGVGIGSGLHLAADAFPNAMRGFATVKLPLAGSIGAWPSYGWLIANAALALALGGTALSGVLPRRLALATGAVMAVAGAGYLFVTDGGWPALAILGGGGAVALRKRMTRKG